MNVKMLIFHTIGLGSLLGTVIFNLFVLLYTFYLVCRFFRLVQKNKEDYRE